MGRRSAMARRGRSAAALAGLLAVAGCVTAPSPAPSVAAPSPSPSPSAIAASPRVVSCSIVLADGAAASPGPVPSALPAALPLDLLPDGAVVVALAYPVALGRPVVYAVAPADAGCEGGVGVGFFMTIRDAADEVIATYETGGGVDPVACRGSRYIEAARRACERTTGATLAPSALAPVPGEAVEPIATSVADSWLALVVAGGGTGNATALLYGFATRPDGIDSWVGSCALHLVGRDACAATLAFMAAAGTDVSAAIASALRE